MKNRQPRIIAVMPPLYTNEDVIGITRSQRDWCRKACFIPGFIRRQYPERLMRAFFVVPDLEVFEPALDAFHCQGQQA